jgi:hypothetical protein
LLTCQKSPLAPSGYQFYRNVKDFGAKGDGVTDDTAAINRAVAYFSSSNGNTLRCGANCGSTTTLGAVVYFPSGTYIISTPIIQYYYTQFVGNPTSKPVIKGSFNFTGIALFDSDFYIPGGNSGEWYINQSNFYRQIRNFAFGSCSTPGCKQAPSLQQFLTRDRYDRPKLDEYRQRSAVRPNGHSLASWASYQHHELRLQNVGPLRAWRWPWLARGVGTPHCQNG